MGKFFLIVVMIAGTHGVANCQTFNEWFRQKKTQKQYLIQQIAALKVYLEYLKKGYNITKKGLNTIDAIKDGNFKDHTTYFASLKAVNPSVKTSCTISLIVAYKVKLQSDFKELQHDLSTTEFLTPEELRYISKVYQFVLTECESAISQLDSILEEDTLQMKDNERLDEIDKLYDEMKDRYTFTQSFCSSTRMLMKQRQHEKFEVDHSAQLNGGL